MKTLTVAQLKALLSTYDENSKVGFYYKTPVKEVSFNQFEGGSYINVNIREMDGDKENSVIKIILE
nr:MAG TPA: hypothetical protein [Bacteriophage sp.]